MNSIQTVKPLTQKLTAKQRKWLKVYSETLNATEAAMQAYDCKDRNTAKQIGWENITKLDFNELMDTMGLTDDLALAGIKEGIRATRPVIDPKTNKISAVADYGVRHKYIETALKLRGKLDTQKIELTGKDGEPLKMEVLAGIGFINKPNVDNPIS